MDSPVRPRKRVGLALGGGVARGLAHIGVLTVLEHSSIPVDFVAGASAGSLIGAPYCAGFPVEALRQVAMKLRWWHFARLVWPSCGLVTFEKMAHWLVKILGDVHFHDLPIPFAAVATDIDSGEPVKLCTGRVAPAVQASCSVPGLVVPVEINGRLLADGCLSNTLPVDVVRAMGADYVIGVDIFTSRIRPRWGSFGMGVNGLEILLRRAGGGTQAADCLISPQLGGKTYFRFSRREEFFALGQQAALEKLDQIRVDLGITDRKPKTAP